MKPNFALTFTSDSIGLLHRTARGWLEIGTTPFDAPDLPEALSYLRRSALGLAPHGVTSKLVLPEDQILYLEMEAPGPSDSVREGQIRRALEGRTPYDVTDLVFDWSGEGRKVQVAVIARETLAEAEAFAAEHRFNPVSFVAHPDPARFAGEPWFGPTALAASLLPPGEAVERDLEPGRVMSRQARADAAAAMQAAVVPPAPEPVVQAPDMPAPEMLVSEPLASEPPPAVWQEPEPLAPDTFDPEAPPAAEPLPLAEATPVTAAQEEVVLQEAPELVQPDHAADAPVQDSPAPGTSAGLEVFPEAGAEGLGDLLGELVGALPTEAPPVQAAFDLDAPLAVPPSALSGGPEVIPPVTTPPRRSKPWTPPPEPGPDHEMPLSGASAARASAPAAEAQLAASQPLPEAAAPEARADGFAEALPADLLARALAAEIPPMPEAPFIAVDDGYELEDLDPAPETSRAAGPKLAVTSVTPRRRAPEAPLLPPATAASAAEPRPYAPDPEDLLTEPDRQPDRQDDLPPPPAASVLAARATGAAPLGAAPQRPGKAAAPLAAKPVAAEPLAKAKTSAKPVKGALAGLVTAPGIAGLGAAKGKAKPAKPATSTLVTAPPAEAQAAATTTLRGRPEMRRGKPRYLGLVLTGLLLLALAIIGAWSSIALSRMNAPDISPLEAPVDQAALPPETAPEEATVADVSAADLAADHPTPDDEAAADGEVLATVPTEAVPETLAETGPAAPAADTGPVPVRLAGEQDEIILSSNDAPPQSSDALTLPPAQASVDSLPAPAVPPPPFGTQYEFGADGLILPTPEGIVTPDGLRLVAGKPPKVPPPRPAAIAALAASSSNVPAAVPAVAADPRLQGFRPRPRPEGLRIPGADDAALDIPAEKRMTSLRPRARPAALAKEAAARAAQLSRQAAQDEAARAAAAAASLSATAAQPGAATVPQGEDATAEAIASAAAIAPRAGPISPQAVTISRRPPQKPRDFNRRVQAAVAAAAAPAPRAKPAPEVEPEEPQRSARSAEPGEDEEPVAPAAKAPKVPTKASVAKNATFANAINLGKTNLIGVYGTPSKRYALIRLGSGQYKKVRVGDRVDGGTVAAITESELRYKKGGRMVALAMPRG